MKLAHACFMLRKYFFNYLKNNFSDGQCRCMYRIEFKIKNLINLKSKFLIFQNQIQVNF